MAEKLTFESLEKLREDLGKKQRNWIRVGMSTCGIAAGAQEVFNIISAEIKNRNIDIDVKRCGCVGMCYAEPLVEVSVEGMPKVFYGKVDKDTAVKIVEKHIGGKMLLNDRIYDVKLSR